MNPHLEAVWDLSTTTKDDGTLDLHLDLRRNDLGIIVEAIIDPSGRPRSTGLGPLTYIDHGLARRNDTP